MNALITGSGCSSGQEDPEEENDLLPGGWPVGFLREHFQCPRCGNCCRWKGYVRISLEEIEVLAEFLGMETERFINEYTRLLPDRSGLSLLDKPTGECLYFDENKGCLIQEVKPKQCRDFPFSWQVPGWDRICEGGRALRRFSLRSEETAFLKPGKRQESEKHGE